MSEASLREKASVESLVARVADEFLERQKNGDRPDIEEYASRHPEAADLLRKVLASLELIALSQSGGPGWSSLATEPTGTLGDFRILREVGRGGMGVVYEVEQISLRRRVALKVLPFAATMDPRHLQRFHNEARAAACLHHAHIVPVYFVGCERSVHFYAMQFIEGQSLAELIAAQRHAPASGVASAPRESPASGVALAPRESHALAALTQPRSPGAATQSIAIATTQAAPRDTAHYRRIAEWGIQAAEALEHAHCLGIVHRDIKPSNLMIDAAGKLWITDFGLARTTTDTGLTMSGDVVGTLRYMSPEQALAKHGLVDHRSDIYALGATLYELLTLRAVVDGMDREEILHTITFEEPPSPRSVDRAIPPDLETIVLKALVKEPAERYATAQDLADDLRRWLLDQPIRARRPSWVQMARKWLRRHQAAAWAASAGLAVAVVTLSVSSLLLWQEKERVNDALQEKETQRRWAEHQFTEANKQRGRAEASFGKVLTGMSRMLGSLEKREWPQLVAIEHIRRAMTEEFEGFFRSYLAENKDDPVARLEVGWAYQHLGVMYLKRGEYALAEKYYRTALAFHEAVAADYPDAPDHITMYAQSTFRLANLLYFIGRKEEARSCFRQAGEQYRRRVQMLADWTAESDLARCLASSPFEELRDPAEAVRAATRAVELAPERLNCRLILGMAQYRDGDSRAAVDTLKYFLNLLHDEDSTGYFFLSMAYWKLGDGELARQNFNQATRELVLERKKKSWAPACERFRAEAAALLGIPEQSTTRAKKGSSREE